VARKKSSKYSPAFKRKAVERMRSCASVVGLARELGVHWRRLYEWKEEMADQGAVREPDPVARREQALQEENARLKAALAEKVLEVDFFRGALQKITARRQRSNGSGKTASSNRSGR
jgi:transposase-like protein